MIFGRPESLDGLTGIRRIAMPLPLRPGSPSSVNCWLLEGADSCALIDTGGPGPVTQKHWQTMLPDLPGISAIVCTHAHADHVGQARWLASELAAPLYLSEAEWQYFGLRSAQTMQQCRASRLDLLRLVGDEKADAVSMEVWAFDAPLPDASQKLSEGDEIELGGRRWTAMLGPGHSPNSINLLDSERRIFICGDQILSELSPWVGVLDWDPLGNPLRDYLEYLSRVECLPDHVIALPGHGAPFSSLGERCRALAAKHRRRADHALLAADHPMTCLDLMPSMFPRRAGAYPQLAIKLGLATLNFLVEEGRLKRTIDEYGRMLLERARGD